jgi:hypothetical protein
VTQKIGPYAILGLLGAGGMGEVFKAERRSPMQQTVAIKIIKLGFDTREIVARFNSERQALARMDHPNVARVLDAGVAENSAPGGVGQGHPPHLGALHAPLVDDHPRLALALPGLDRAGLVDHALGLLEPGVLDLDLRFGLLGAAAFASPVSSPRRRS